MTEFSPFADLPLRNFPPVPDEELFKDIDDAAADNKEDECSKWGGVCALEKSKILERKMENAAPQSIKTMATHFHNFILKWLRALALCEKNKTKQMVINYYNL